MFISVRTLITASAGMASAATIQTKRDGGGISVTPHEQYSSSIGVLGCKINTNRVAYWPEAVGCDNICVKVSYQGRSVNLLKVDQSTGAHDISYDAWNFLVSGQSATAAPQQGGGVAMTYETVSPEECRPLLTDGALPLSAANSMNFVASCLQQPGSWVAQNHELLNILDPVCHFGFDEKCALDLAQSNQPACPHALGLPNAFSGPRVMNIAYGTGQQVPA
jgi:hypothetical protein